MNLRDGLCAVLIVALVSCGSSKEREQQYLEKAKALIKQDNQDKARIELKNVLQINPKNTDARYLMAQLAENDRDWQKMYDFLTSLVVDNPDLMEAQIKLGGLFLLSGDVEKASEKAELVLSHEPGNPHAMTLKAAIDLRNNHGSEAEALLQKVLVLEPGNLDAIYLLIKHYADSKEYNKALKIIDTSIPLYAKELNLALMKVQVLTWLGRPEQAEAVIFDLLQRFPENNQLYYSAAKYYVMIHKTDKGEQVLKDLIAKQPTETEPKLALAEYLLSQKNTAKAEQVLVGFIKDEPGNFSLSFALAELYKNKPDKAIKVLSQIIQSDPNGPNGLKAKIMLAIHAQNKGDKTQAMQLAEQVISADPHNSDALMFRSNLLEEQGQYDAAIADLRTVLRDQPNSEKALLLSARTQLKSGFFDLAQESLENALAINPSNIDVRKDLARLLVKNKDPERAISLLESIGKTKKQNAEVLSMLTDLYVMNQSWDKAEETAKSIGTLENRGLSQFKLAQAYFAQKKYSSALSAYLEVLKIKPLATDALAGLIDTYLAMGEADKAGSTLDQLLADNPGNIDLLNLRGFLYKNQKKFSEAEQVFSHVIKLNKSADHAYGNLASIYIQQNQLGKALSTYQEGLKTLPENINLLLGMASLYEKTAKQDAAIDVYTKLLKIAPGNKVAANNLAAIIADTSEDSAQLSKAYELVKSFKNSNEPALLDTYGWLSFLNGQTDAAVNALEKVIELDPNFVEFNYHLGMIYASNNRLEEAKLALQKALSKGADFPGKAKAEAKLAELNSAP